MLKINNNSLCFLPLGGSGEIGMNLNLYHYKGKWIMVDLGVSFDRKLGIELVMPRIDFIKDIIKNLIGIVITHGHEDHIGAIPHLWTQLKKPIYATKFTAELIRGKLKPTGLLEEAQIIEVDTKSAFNLNPFNIQYVSITHSIPESHLLKISTDAGIIVHTGDWKFDKNPLIGKTSDLKQIENIGNDKVLALVCDSTNIFEKGRSGSELDVRKSLETIIKKQKKRIIVTCFASNIARVITLIQLARKYNKKVILAGRSLWKMIKNAEKCGYIDSIEDILTEKAFSKTIAKDTMILCTGSQGEQRAALFKIASQQHSSIKLEANDTVIFSSKIIPGNEKEVTNLHELLLQKKINIITDQDEFTHVSGHPNQDELKEMYSLVKPKILIPVHGENSHIRAHTKFALDFGIPHSIAAKNGHIIDLSNKPGPKELGVVENGRTVLDGKIISDIDSKHLQQRQKIMCNGAVFISINRKKISDGTGVKISILGLPNQDAKHPLALDIETIIYDSLENIPEKKINNSEALSQHIINIVQKFIKILVEKKPTIHCHIVD